MSKNTDVVFRRKEFKSLKLLGQYYSKSQRKLWFQGSLTMKKGEGFADFQPGIRS